MKHGPSDRTALFLGFNTEAAAVLTLTFCRYILYSFLLPALIISEAL